MNKRAAIQISGLVAAAVMVGTIGFRFVKSDRVVTAENVADVPAPVEPEPVPVLDTVAYDLKLQQLAGEAPPALWPAEAVYPNVGALLPFNRIVAYYGNFESKGMGVLGQYPPDEVLERLKGEVQKWEEADPTTPVVPGIDYIAVVAEAGPGDDGMYRTRMPDAQIQKALTMAEEVHGIVILEVQAGLSDVLEEVRALEPYLSLPQVHLAIDPEFAMKKSGKRPGSVVGTVDAEQVNAVADELASLVQAHHLPPKILVVHRYTSDMVTHAENISPLPEVQIVMDMDGWGSQGSKIQTYLAYIYGEPVQFTGFKLFYHNDTLQPGSHLFTPEEILKLSPQPSFIQYQ